MTQGTVRRPGGSRPVAGHPPAEARRRTRQEFTDVRHPLHPGLRVERVLVCPSGIHVVTSVATWPSSDGVADAGPVAAARAAADLVTGLLPERYRPRVRPVLVATGAASRADLVDGVLVTTPETFEHILRSSLVVLSTSEVQDVGLRLAARLEACPVGAPGPRTRRSRWSRGRTLLVTAGAATCAGVGVLLERTGTIAHLW